MQLIHCNSVYVLGPILSLTSGNHVMAFKQTVGFPSKDLFQNIVTILYTKSFEYQPSTFNWWLQSIGGHSIEWTDIMPGLELSRFVDLSERESKHLICSICLNIFNNAVVSECGHTFCKDCVHQWIRDNHRECPECRKEFAVLEPASESSTMLAQFRFTRSLKINTISWFRRHSIHLFLYYNFVICAFN